MGEIDFLSWAKQPPQPAGAAPPPSGEIDFLAYAQPQPTPIGITSLPGAAPPTPIAPTDPVMGELQDRAGMDPVLDPSLTEAVEGNRPFFPSLPAPPAAGVGGALSPKIAMRNAVSQVGTGLANAPASLGNMAGGMASMGFRGVRMLGRDMVGAGAEAIGLATGNDLLAEAGQDVSDQGTEDLKKLAEEAGGIITDMVKVPASAAQPLISALAPAIGQVMKEKGWGFDDFKTKLVEDPVGTIAFLLPVLHGAKGLVGKTAELRSGPQLGTLDRSKALPPENLATPESVPRETPAPPPAPPVAAAPPPEAPPVATPEPSIPPAPAPGSSGFSPGDKARTRRGMFLEVLGEREGPDGPMVMTRNNLGTEREYPAAWLTREGEKPGALEAPLPKQVQRYDKPGKEPSVSKAQGLYTTPADIVSPHADIGEGAEPKRFDVNPDAKVLRVDISGALEDSNRGAGIGESSGIAALREMVGPEETNRLLKIKSKEATIAEVSKRFPDVEWNRYYDALEVLEGYAGKLARERGYDAIYGLETEHHAMSEYVALTENAFKKSEGEGARPVGAEGGAATSPPASPPAEPRASVPEKASRPAAREAPGRSAPPPEAAPAGNAPKVAMKERVVKVSEPKAGADVSTIKDSATLKEYIRTRHGGVAPLKDSAGKAVYPKDLPLRLRRTKAKGGATIEEIGRDLAENGLFPDDQAARNWVEEALTNDIGLERQEAPKSEGSFKQAERDADRLESKRQEATLKTVEVQAERFGLEDPAAAVKKAKTSVVEEIPAYDLKPGEVIFLPEKNDVVRVKVNAEGEPYLQDGKRIKLGDEQVVSGVRLGEMRKPEGRIRMKAAEAVDPLAAVRAEVAEAKKIRVKKQEVETKVEKRRKQAQKEGQGSLLDEELNKRIDKERVAVDEALDFEKGQPSFFVKDETMAEARKRLKQKLSGPKAGIDPTAIREIVILGVGHAERIARRSAKGVADFATWAKAVRTDVYSLGYMLSKEHLERLWNHAQVTAARVQSALTKQPAPKATGQLKTFMRESGDRGQMVFDETRRGRNRAALMGRLVDEQHVKMAKGLSKQAVRALDQTARGIAATRHGDGSLKYGTIQRRGVIRAYDRNGNRIIANSGTMLPDGRFIGGNLQDGKHAQLYRVVFEDEARAMHEALKRDHPDAAKLLDAFLAESEPIVVTAMGDRLPSMSRKALKEQYDVEGLDPQEASLAASYARQAYGPGATALTIPEEMSWVPDAGYFSKTLMGRVRNQLREIRSEVRGYKKGEIAEKVSQGTIESQFIRAWGESRKSLGRELGHNELAPRLLSLAAESMKRGDTLESFGPGGINEGYRIFSKTGLWGESARVRRFIDRHADWFEQMGINVPETSDALFKAGGKGYKIPSYIADALNPEAISKTTSVRPEHRAFWKAVDSFAANTIGAINVFRLTRPSTAFRNLLTNQVLFSAKVIRDFVRGILGSTANLARYQEHQIAPFAPFVSDIRALGSVLGKKTRTRLPAEALGVTFTQALEQGGLMAEVGGKLLRATGFNAYDVYTKRVIVESVIDAASRQAWAAAKRLNQTGGLTKAKFIDRFKLNVPKEIESLSYREMDAWGGYDYGNVPPRLAGAKRSATFRGTLPYPTYYYKLLNTMNEMAGLHNWRDAFGPNVPREKRINAIANLTAFTTLAGISWKLAQQTSDLPPDVKDSDLPYEMQTTGRIDLAPTLRKILPASVEPDEDEGIWVRMSDVPFLGEAMSAQAIWKGDMTFGDYINSRVALGPLFNAVAMASGLATRFNKDIPVGSRLGREMASWVPFANEAQTIRRLKDPFRRDVGDETTNGATNFARAFGENWPFLSDLQVSGRDLIPKKINTATETASTYKKPEVLLSYFLLNTHFVNKHEREAAIALASLQNMENGLAAINKELVRMRVEQTMDALGHTLTGDIKQASALDPAQIEEKTEKTFWKMTVAQAFLNYGPEAAWKAYDKLIDESNTEYAKVARDGARKWIMDQEKLSSRGSERKALKAAPPDVREKYFDKVDEAEKIRMEGQ